MTDHTVQAVRAIKAQALREAASEWRRQAAKSHFVNGPNDYAVAAVLADSRAERIEKGTSDAT